MESENLTVIGHTGDLLVDIYTAKCDAYLHSYRSAQRRRQACSIPPEWMLNLSGRAAQSRAEYSQRGSGSFDIQTPDNLFLHIAILIDSLIDSCVGIQPLV